MQRALVLGGGGVAGIAWETLAVFDRTSGVDLVDAVAASCAVPLVTPPVTIGHQRYIDGGMWSSTNAGAARGADDVVVIAPMPRSATEAGSIRAQLAATGATRTAVITPDRAARAAMGPNPTDPGRRADAARAGERQAVEAVRDLDI